jgi:hypothetical protein
MCSDTERVCLDLTLEGETCVYNGPSVFKAGPVTFIFNNDSGQIATSNMIRLDEGKTIQDVVEYNGPEPSSKHHPPWSTEILGVYGQIKDGRQKVWEGTLEPGVHAVVCATSAPLEVWLGGGFTVEE